MAKCCVASIALHLGLLALVLICAANKITSTPPVSIDFTLSPPPLPAQVRENPVPTAAAPTQTPVNQKQPTAAIQTPTAREPEQAKPEPQPNSTEGNHAAPTPTAPQASKTVAQHSIGPVSSHQETQGTEAAPRGAQTGGRMTTEKAQQRYLNEHFTYIRNLIIKRLVYPRIARRMGWSGRVVLTFVVAEDGNVHSLHVRESSGYPVLDNSAMETVKSVAPFPRPPVAAEIVMPVQFQLQ
jgi:protein TonB